MGILQEQLNSFIQTYKKGGEISSFQVGGTMTVEEFLKYHNGYDNKPKYGFGDFEPSLENLKEWAKELNVSTDGVKLKNIDDLHSFAGVLQKESIKQNKSLIDHYTTKKPFTKEDVDRAIELGITDKKWFQDRGVKFGKNGKALRGTLESGMKMEDALKMSDEFGTILGDEKNKEAKEKFVGAFNDNKWYYRRPIIKTVKFNNEEEKNNFVKDYTDVGNGVYYSNKTGLYFKPQIGDAPATEATTTPETTPTTEGGDKDVVKSTLNSGDFKAPLRMPAMEPDQRMNMETGVDVGYLGRVESPHFQKLNVSYEPLLSANYQSAMSALNSLRDAPGMSGNAMVNSILGQTQQANNQAIAQTTAQNQNIESQIERANEQAVATADQMNLQLATNYNNQWMQGDANLDMINRTINKFNTDVGINSYKNQKMREYIADTLGVRVGDGITMSPDFLQNNQLGDVLNRTLVQQAMGIQNQQQTPKKSQKGGYIREFLNKYNKK